MREHIHTIAAAVPFKTYWNTTPIARLAGGIFVLAFCLHIGSALLQLTALGWVSIVLLMIGGGVACHAPGLQSGDRSSRDRSGTALLSFLRAHDWRSWVRAEREIYQGYRDQHDVTAPPTFPDYRLVPSHERPLSSVLPPALWWSTLVFMLLLVGTAYQWGGDFSPPLPPAASSLWVLGGITVAILLVHELLHAAVAVWFGATVSIGVFLPVAAYMRPSNVLLTRRQRLIVGLVPGVSLSLLGAICVLVGSGWVLAVGVVLLGVNVASSSADAILVWRVLTAPPGSQWYRFPDGKLSRRYDPVSASPSVATRLQQRVFRATEWMKLPTEGDGEIDE